MATSVLSATASSLSTPSSLSIHTLSANPVSSAAIDLEHYKALFSKLRFSYTEQVTKERFLKSLVADPPDLPTDDTSALEAKLAADKASLKALKAAVAAQLDALAQRGRAVAAAHDALLAPAATLVALPEELDALTADVAQLRAANPTPSANPLLNHSLPVTRGLLAERREESDALAAESSAVRRAVEARSADAERLKGELEGAEERKRSAVAEVMEIRKRKRLGGGWDEEEKRGRWVRAQAGVLEGLVG